MVLVDGDDLGTEAEPKADWVFKHASSLKQMRLEKTSIGADSLCEIATRGTLPASKLRVNGDYESDQGATVSSKRNDAATVSGPDRWDSTDGECHEAGKYSPLLEVASRISRVFEKPLGEVFQSELLDLLKVGQQD